MRTNNPSLRFRNKSGTDFPDWQEVRLGDVAEIIMGQSPESKNYTDENEYIVLVQGNADIKNSKITPRVYTKEVTKLCKIDDIIMTVRAPVGELAISDIEACIGRGVCAIRYNKFIFYFLEKFNFMKGWNSVSTGTTFEAVNSNSIKELALFLPRLEEQQKIAGFFSEIDSTIELEEKLLANMKLHKTGMMQRMFSKSGEAPEVRFKSSKGADYPAFEITNLLELINESGKRNKDLEFNNVLSVNNKLGFIPQSEKFEDRQVASIDTSNYKIVGKDMYAYNPSRINVGSIARMKDNFIGIVSPMYIVFSLSNKLIPGFFDIYITKMFKDSIISNTAGSVRDSVNFTALQRFEIILPCLEEQEKISAFFSELDSNIKNQAEKIKNIKEYKKGLMQKMFV